MSPPAPPRLPDCLQHIDEAIWATIHEELPGWQEQIAVLLGELGVLGP
ncbi:MAG: hypothetical protein ABIR94_22215 [Rubrivivax sp.]